ncbi:beta-lactamase regulator AmpE [Colwelliaceae bacterium 6471]
MSLISLLIALTAQRHLSSSKWQFNTYYTQYLSFFSKHSKLGELWQNPMAIAAFVTIPVLIAYLLLNWVDDSVLHLILSTLLLIISFGCIKTRDTYKNYLLAAYRGETTTCELFHQQLQQDKNLPQMGFGQTLVWLNYRYFIAVMIFFVLFGAPGALLYRLMITVSEQPQHSKDISGEENTLVDPNEHLAVAFANKILFWLDWLPVRLVAFGYMLVGHFSKALPTWLENIFDINSQAHNVLINVAEKSEDFMVDADDCTAEPCLLVRLAKRTLLLCLAVVAVLTLTGIII